MTLTPIQNSQVREFPVVSTRTLETATLVVLVGMVFWSVAPLLEEWALLNAFRSVGFGYLGIFASSNPLRPLHLSASALQWFLGDGHPIGVTIATALMLVFRYLIVRWAVTPILDGHARWVVATLAAVMLAWPGAWMGRFGPAQLSALLLFVILGCAVRLYVRWSLTWALTCLVCVLGILSSYQAVVLCLAVLPLLALLWQPHNSTTAGIHRLAGALRVTIALASGAIAFGVYAMLVTRAGAGGYEADLARGSTRLLTLSGMGTHLLLAYSTAFGSSLLLPLLLLVVAILVGPAVAALPDHRSQWRHLAGIAALVLTVPLFGMIYLSEGHIRDPDRVLFPVISGFVLICISILAWLTTAGAQVTRMAGIAVVLVAVLTGGLTASEVREFARIQTEIIDQTQAAIHERKPGSVLIVDTTGMLGDVYTLLNPTITDALANRGIPVPASICTPLPLDRFHPVARRFPIETTPRCEQAPPMAAPTLVLTTRLVDGKLALMR